MTYVRSEKNVVYKDDEVVGAWNEQKKIVEFVEEGEENEE